MQLPAIIHTISDVLASQKAKAIIVGGSVRDHFLNLPIKDYDIEVYGLESLEVLRDILATYGTVNLVGKHFGVLKFSYEDEVYDFSFPRTETKVAKGHGGFDVITDGSLCFEDAAKRRDFTINAMGYDVQNKVFLDPFGGKVDLDAKCLRHIDDKTFVEDPLRVYRAVQFAGRFDFEVSPKTALLCKQMVEQDTLSELPKERIFEEFKKLLLKAKKPSIGFELMREWGVLLKYFPELQNIIGIPQSPKWHPEGDVWVHTMMCVDEMAHICRLDNTITSTQQKLKFLFAILCHDLGKAIATTVDKNGRIRAIGHEYKGIEPTKSLMYRLSNEHDFIASLLPLVEHHLKPSQFYAAKSKDAAIRRLATKVNIEELVLLAKADFLGRSTPEALAKKYYAGQWLLDKAKALNVNKNPPKPLIQGRDLIALGYKPSPKFKKILDEIYTLQLEGKINSKEEALTYIRIVDKNK